MRIWSTLIDRARRWREPGSSLTILGDLTARRVAAAEEQAAVTAETYLGPNGALIDSDGDAGFRPVTAGLRSNMTRDLTPIQQDRMIQIAWWLSETNPLAKRLIELMTDLIVGEGITVSASDPKIADIVAATWNHPLNKLGDRCMDFYRAASLNGELILPVARNPLTRIPQIGYLDPLQVKEVRPRPGNALIVDAIVLKGEGGNDGETLKVVNWNPETGKLEGDCFYWRVNALPNSGRGRSDLLAVADWLDIYDSIMFSEVERMKALSAHVWDYRIDTNDEKVIQKKLQALGTPRSGQVFAHNGKEELQARTPNINGADRSEVNRMLAIHIGGSMGFPISWLGFIDSTNATIQGQNDVMLKTPSRRQKQFAAFLGQILQFAIEGATAVNPAYYRATTPEFEVHVPEIAAKDVARVGSIVSSVVSAMDVSMANGTMSRRAAMVTIASVLRHLGVNLDIDEVMKEADAELAEKQARDDERLAAQARMTALAQQAQGQRTGRAQEPDDEGDGRVRAAA
jgi:hypothetical protein